MNRARITTLLLAAALITTTAQAEPWTGHDKELHFVGGAAIAAAVTAATHDEFKGFLAGAAVGVVKEVVDERRYGGASAKDAIVTALGALIGAKFSGWALTPKGFTHTRRINIF